MCGWFSCTPLLGTWSPTHACALTGNQTGNPLVHRPALNPLSYTSQGHPGLLLKSPTLACPGQYSALVWINPVSRKVKGSSPSQGTCLGCGFGPWLGHVQGATNQCFSPSLPLFLESVSLSSGWGIFKKMNQEMNDYIIIIWDPRTNCF